MSVMMEEIRQQPNIVRKTIETEFHRVDELRDAIIKHDIRFAYIAARGTSDNVAHYAKYVLEIEHGIPVALAAPSVFTLYNAVPHLDEHALVIGISQSGSGPDVIAVLERARTTGALTACITNEAESDLAKACEYPLVTPAGPEKCIAATKTYTAALAMIALLSTSLDNNRPERLEHLWRTADIMQQTLELDDAIRQLVERYEHMTNCVVICRGYNHCTALEVALKLTETSYVGAKSFSAADFLHGPVAQVDEGFPVLLFAPDGKAYKPMMELAAALKNRHPDVIAFAHDLDFLAGSETAIRIPGSVPEWLSPLVYVVAGQLFANWLSIAKNLDPDHPRGLTKITKTR
jgi:glucosamine--fructose-6-phosphate aminotransferase (isomerizing)